MAEPPEELPEDESGGMVLDGSDGGIVLPAPLVPLAPDDEPPLLAPPDSDGMPLAPPDGVSVLAGELPPVMASEPPLEPEPEPPPVMPAQAPSSTAHAMGNIHLVINTPARF